jgi:lysophospholipase L1-like esterase
VAPSSNWENVSRVDEPKPRDDPVTEARAGDAPWRRLSRVGGNLALAGTGLLAALLLCEALLRLLGVSFPVYVWTDPVRGLAHIPGAKSGYKFEGRSWIEINSDGMRGPEVSLAHPAGTYRIALLGDSFIEGFEVPFDSTVGEIMRRRLSALRGTPVEVLNFGTGGYGTTQELLTLRNQVWKFSPDLVVLAFTTGNDVTDNYRPLDPGGYRPYYVFRDGHLMLDTTFRTSSAYQSRAVWTRRLLGMVQQSRLVQLINRVRHLSRKRERQQTHAAPRAPDAGGVPGSEVGLSNEVQLPPSTPAWQEAWRVTEGVLGLMRDDCRQRGTPFAVVTLTRGIQVTPVPAEKEKFLRQIGAQDLYYPERRVAEFGRREGVPVLNLAPTMAEEAERRHVYFHAAGPTIGIGHWNGAGHRAAGELIAAWLAQEFPAASATAPRSAARP